MRLVITPEESNRLDAASEEPVEILMERAGLGVALAAAAMGIGYGSRVAVLAGRGNNGGDGYVAARYLKNRGAQVTVHALGYPRGDYSPARLAAIRAAAAGVKIVELGDPEPADLVIDALFGVGFRGELPGAVLPWLDHDGAVLSVDVPSGLQAGTGTVAGESFTADVTVTFHALKPGHLLGGGPERCGFVDVVDIGLKGGVPELRLCDAVDAPVANRSRTAHKWSVGSVAVVGSSRGMVGAGVLTAQSALNAGAGSASVVCPAGTQAQVAAMTPGLLTHGFGNDDRFDSDDLPAVLEYTDRFDVVVLGPGLGSDDGFTAEFVARREGKLLIDADGLNNLGSVDTLASRKDPTIITPHAGEFRRLTGRDASHEAASTVHEETGAVVLLKGNPTFVLGSERWVVTSGGPELATIGTGDVLAGVVSALWACGLDGEVAARSGAFWHGVAGSDLASRRTVTATELMSAIGEFL
ncbi:MAG: NAD(P)H-hydrate dehydratase [Acidimicrobiia bacterium]|nr:NAD(P)H-hydrate dehydratase [Acidimicrobiia bacterium]